MALAIDSLLPDSPHEQTPFAFADRLTMISIACLPKFRSNTSSLTCYALKLILYLPVSTANIEIGELCASHTVLRCCVGLDCEK